MNFHSRLTSSPAIHTTQKLGEGIVAYLKQRKQIEIDHHEPMKNRVQVHLLIMY